MKAAEILRKLADMIDQHSTEGDVERPVNSVPHAELEPVDVDNTDNTETSTMVPPLQQKIELLKKSVGVDNHYDDEESCGCSEEPDELEIIKQHAGIRPVALHIASDDEPLDM